jgi:hypothetical protein
LSADSFIYQFMCVSVCVCVLCGYTDRKREETN